MNKRNTLSIAPYYGGKGRMAHFIADRLNYDDSDIFVTPFGGMCRVLLNKPRHKIECYNDYSSGLTALMRILSNPDKAVEFIHRLDDETTYSEEEFNKQKAIFDDAESDLEQLERAKLRQMLIDKKVVSAVTANSLIDEIGLHPVRSSSSIKAKHKKIMRQKENPMSHAVENALEKLGQRLKDDKVFRDNFQKQLGNWIGLFREKSKDSVLIRGSDLSRYDEMDLAIATYVVFQQSRDGMGQTWSAEKFKSDAQYKKQVAKLFDCAERLEGVEVFQIDAVDFFRKYGFADVDLSLEDIDPRFLMINRWISNPRVMMLCDPSYISPVSEGKWLEGIDVESEPCLYQAILDKYNGKHEPKNLGEVYAKSFNYSDQEKFLRCIQKAKCRILVCNYDLQLYNKYLNEDTGWHREEFHTTTGVGSKKDNKRVEVIWYNY